MTIQYSAQDSRGLSHERDAQNNNYVFSMGFIPALKIEASGGSQARNRKAHCGKYARGVLDNGSYKKADKKKAGRRLAACLAAGILLFVLLAGLPAQAETIENQNGILSIDDTHIYEGMNQPYSRGYEPNVENGRLMLVLPLQSEENELPLSLRAALSFGDMKNNPFVVRNYQKTVRREKVQTKSGDWQEIYLVSFEVELDADRVNGTYPVNVQTQYWLQGMRTTQEFPVYVRITDGKSGIAQGDGGSSLNGDNSEDLNGAGSGNDFLQNPSDGSGVSQPYGGTDTSFTGMEDDGGNMGSAGPGEEKPTSEPKIILTGCEGLSESVTAGNEQTVTVQLKNTSGKKYVQNMTVTVTIAEPGISLKADSNVFYIEKLASGKTTELPLTFAVSEQTLAGKYPIGLDISYDNPDAAALTSSMQFNLTVAQRMDVGFEVGEYAEEMNAGDSMVIPIQAMNLGRDMIYNVRCEISVPGLEAKTSLFLGNLDGGTAGAGEMTVFAGMVYPQAERETERYGYTAGTLDLIFEDGAGTEYRQSQEMSIKINPLVIAGHSNDEEEPEVNLGRQLLLGVVGIAASVLVLIFLPRWIRKKRGDNGGEIFD